MGMSEVERMTIATAMTKQMMSASQNRRRILGTSSQKLERSTSFFVAPQVMLYEMRWAISAWERWILRPPKKKKLSRRCVRRDGDAGESGGTYKNETQVMFSMNESSSAWQDSGAVRPEAAG